MEIKDAAALGGFLVGVVGLGVAWFYRRRDQPRIAYRICQLADYGVDAAFFSELGVCPVLIKLKNISARLAKKVQVQVRVRTTIPLVGCNAKSSTGDTIRTWQRSVSGSGRDPEIDYCWDVEEMRPRSELWIHLKFNTGVCDRPIEPQKVLVYLNEGRTKLMHDWP